MNNLVLLGRIVDDIHIEQKGDFVWVKNTLAVNERKKENGQYVDDTMFIDFIAFGNNAITIANHSDKGKRIILGGALKQERWIDKDNNKKIKYYLNVDKVSLVDFKEKEENNG